MIQLEQLVKYHRTHHTLRSVSLSVPNGSIFGIVGKSGAGKSTLLRCVNLLERPDTGKVIVNQKNLMTLSPGELRKARHHMGMIFQHFNLLNAYTVYENIALPLKLATQDPKAIDAKITELLHLIGLSHKRSVYPAQLSGGEKQRVAIARALTKEPTLLLADEPTSALDPYNTQIILNLLSDINEKLGITILLITHEIAVVKQICDEVAIMDHGKIIEQDRLINLLKRPKTGITEALLKGDPKQTMPATLKSKLIHEPKKNTVPLWRIWFNSNTSAEPYIAQIIQRYQVVVNLYQANIDYIHHEATGIMLATIAGDPQNIEHARLFLIEKDNDIELVGYLHDHITL